MSELGETLKHTREEKNLSLEELQGTTKIQKRYLQAIEKGDFDQLPGQFYARAFIKNYAEALGLDPDRLFEEYSEEIPGPNRQWPNSLPAGSVRERPQNPGYSKFPALIPKLLAAVAVIGILLVIYLVFFHFIPDSGEDAGNNKGGSVGLTENPDKGKQTDKADQDTGKDTSDSKSSSEQKPKESDKQRGAKQKLEKTGSEGNVVHYTLKNADAFKLKLKVTDSKSWIEVRRSGSDGKAYEYSTFQDGKTITHDLSKDKKVYLNIGSTPNVKMSINGKSFTYPSDSTTQRFLITYEATHNES